MDAAAVQLRQNSLQSALGDLKGIVVVLEAQGSPAALWDGPNRPAFDALTAGIDDGAVTANLRAAAATEDQTGLEPVETSVGGAMSAALSTDEGEPSPRPSRIQDYEAAIARASFSRLSPVLVAHRMSLSLFCASDLEGADGRLTAFFVEGATRLHVGGFLLLSGSVSAAQVANWLCCDIPSDEQPSMLPSVAAAVQKVHAVASGAAASSV
ncbi:hypothetical protein I4F81_000625 [Pyropia yezoensis]|uniref:Uncharacterized protein n=1 Tax=Pyropia yezoensis TaxID=2788 RepID=A0ACC3BJU4_PYRYE|nr:hypothetical protein I4F81_000625 [Neopyropia yezoensis]